MDMMCGGRVEEGRYAGDRGCACPCPGDGDGGGAQGRGRRRGGAAARRVAAADGAACAPTGAFDAGHGHGVEAAVCYGCG